MGRPGAMAQSSERLEGQGGPDEAALLLHEEELVVGKRTVDNGGILLKKTVETQEVQKPVELEREEYTIERIPADKLESVDDDAMVFQENEIFVPLSKEIPVYKQIPVVNKKPRVTEWVRVNKVTKIDNRTITHPLRKENIEIVRQEAPENNESVAAASNSASEGTGMGAPGALGQSSQTMTATGGSSETPEREEQQSADLPLYEEDLVVSKQRADNGGVFLRKVVETHTGSQPIQLKREEYEIDRTPANGQPANNPPAGAEPFQAREIYIPLTREEPVVNTRTFVTEEVRLKKEIKKDQRTITDTVRKEKLELEED